MGRCLRLNLYLIPGIGLYIRFAGTFDTTSGNTDILEYPPISRKAGNGHMGHCLESRVLSLVKHTIIIIESGNFNKPPCIIFPFYDIFI